MSLRPRIVAETVVGGFLEVPENLSLSWAESPEGDYLLLTKKELGAQGQEEYMVQLKLDNREDIQAFHAERATLKVMGGQNYTKLLSRYLYKVLLGEVVPGKHSEH